MSRRKAARQLGSVFALSLVLALTVARPGMASGRHSGSPAARTQESGLSAGVWGWLADWWQKQEARGHQGLSRLWEAMGPEMDPDGKARATTDMGPEMDPNGGAHAASACGAAACTDAGFGMDPNGSH